MSPEITNIIKQLIPTLGIFVFVAVLYFTKLMMDKNKYAKQSENHVLIFTLPKAGKLRNELVPVEVQGGISIVKVPDTKGEITPQSPTHILGEAGEFPVDYPIGKPRFVQATVQSLFYYEGDAEPLSNVSDRPIVSAQLLTNINDGTASSSADAMRKSMEDSTGQKFKKASGLIWLYVLVFVVAGIGIANVVLQVQGNTSLQQFIDILSQSLGITTGTTETGVR